jgi:cytochrome b involved in lipid metabolism
MGHAFLSLTFTHSHLLTHSGGLVINKFLGDDCTDQFEAFHQPRTQKLLKNFWIGVCKDAPQPSAGMCMRRNMYARTYICYIYVCVCDC